MSSEEGIELMAQARVQPSALSNLHWTFCTDLLAWQLHLAALVVGIMLPSGILQDVGMRFASA